MSRGENFAANPNAFHKEKVECGWPRGPAGKPKQSDGDLDASLFFVRHPGGGCGPRGRAPLRLLGGFPLARGCLAGLLSRSAALRAARCAFPCARSLPPAALCFGAAAGLAPPSSCHGLVTFRCSFLGSRRDCSRRPDQGRWDASTPIYTSRGARKVFAMDRPHAARGGAGPGGIAAAPAVAEA